MSYKPYVYKRAEDLGIDVVAGKSRILVTVTANDVVNAKKANSKHCALARASLRLPGVNAAYFFRQTAFLEYKDRMERFELPPSVQKEIVSFDRAQIFSEGTYQLTPPPPSRESSKARKKEYKRRKVARAHDKVNNTPEQREFDAKVAKLVGGRIVSGIKKTDAHEPLPNRPPTRYVHRTKYVRDLREPE